MYKCLCSHLGSIPYFSSESMLGLFVLVHPWGVSALVTSTHLASRGWTHGGSTFVAAAGSVAKPQEAYAATGSPFNMPHFQSAYASSAKHCAFQMALQTLTKKVIQEDAFLLNQRRCLAKNESLMTHQTTTASKNKAEATMMAY